MPLWHNKNNFTRHNDRILFLNEELINNLSFDTYDCYFCIVILEYEN